MEGSAASSNLPDRSKSKMLAAEPRSTVNKKGKKPAANGNHKAQRPPKKTVVPKQNTKPAAGKTKGSKVGKSKIKKDGDEGLEEHSDSFRDGSQCDKESETSSHTSDSLQDDYSLDSADSHADESDCNSDGSSDESRDGEEEITDSDNTGSRVTDTNSEDSQTDELDQSSRDKSSKTDSKHIEPKRKSFLSKEVLEKLRKEGLGLDIEEKSIKLGSNSLSKAKKSGSPEKFEAKKFEEAEPAADRHKSVVKPKQNSVSRLIPESDDISNHSEDSEVDHSGGDNKSDGEDNSSSGSSVISPNENEDLQDYEVGGYHPVYIGEEFKQGRYRVVKKLGHGHFSTVWMAEDKQATTKSGKWVALKIQKSKKNHNEAALDEVKLLNQIKECSKKDGWYVSCAQMIRMRPHTEELLVIKEDTKKLSTSKQPKGKKVVGKKTEKAINTKRKLPGFSESESAEPTKPTTDGTSQSTEVPQQNYENFTVQILDNFSHQGPHGEHQVAVFPLLGPTMLEVIRFFEKRTPEMFEDFNPKKPNYKYQYLKQGVATGIPAPIVRSMLQQMLLGFHFMHTYARIIHTDLKPENVLMVLGDEGMEVLDEIGKIADSSQLTETLSKKISSPKSSVESNRASIPLSQRFLISKAEDPLYKKHYQEMLESQKKTTGAKARKTAANKFMKFIATKKSQLKDDEENCSFVFWWKGIIPVRLSPSTKVRIADLGNGCYLSKHFTECIQTREYRAPEALVGQPYSSSTDLWSLGCMVFEMLTGDYLFRPESFSGESLKDMAHLRLIESALGRIPLSVISGSVRQNDYFTKEHKVKKPPKKRDYKDFERDMLDSEDSRSDDEIKLSPVPEILVFDYGMDEEAALEFYLGIRPMLEYSSERRDRAWNVLMRKSWIWGDIGIDEKSRWISRYRQQLDDLGFDIQQASSILGKRAPLNHDAADPDEQLSDSEEEELDEKTLTMMIKHLNKGFSIKQQRPIKTKGVVNLSSPRRQIKGVKPVYDSKDGSTQKKLQMVALEMSRNRLAQDLKKSGKPIQERIEEEEDGIDQDEVDSPFEQTQPGNLKQLALREANRLYGLKHTNLFKDEADLEEEELFEPTIPQHYSGFKKSSMADEILNLKKAKATLDQKMAKIGFREKIEYQSREKTEYPSREKVEYQSREKVEYPSREKMECPSKTTSEGKSRLEDLSSPKQSPMVETQMEQSSSKMEGEGLGF